MKGIWWTRIVFILLLVVAGLAVPARTAQAAPTVNEAMAVPNMISLFGDNASQSRGSPFGPGWTSVVVKVTPAGGTTVSGVTIKLGDFLKAILPDGVDSKVKSTMTSQWSSFITSQNSTAMTQVYNSGGVQVWKTVVQFEGLLDTLIAYFDTATFRRIIEQEFRMGAKTLAGVVTASDGTATWSIGGTADTNKFWVVDAQILLRQGWNLRSAPMAMGDNTWAQILALGNKSFVGLRYNPTLPLAQQWSVLQTTDTINPLEGIYVYATQNDALGAKLFRSASSVVTPAAKSLLGGAWNLIGTAPDFTENFSLITPSGMRGMLAIDAALKSVEPDPGLLSGWVTAVSLGEPDATVTTTYSYTGVTSISLGSYNWKFGQPGWSFTRGVDSIQTMASYDSTKTKGWTIPFGGYWVYTTGTRTLAAKNLGILTDEWMVKLLTLQ